MTESINQVAQLLRGASHFPVPDVERSMIFYDQVLGFGCDYYAGTPVGVAICSRDGLGVILRQVSKSELTVPNEKRGGMWDAFFWIRDARALHFELKSKGADIVYGPILGLTYHMKEFAVRDCDGHILGFGESLVQRSRAGRG